MQGFKFSTDPFDVMEMISRTIMNPGPGYGSTTEIPKCFNPQEVLKGAMLFISLAIKYGWYKYLLKEVEKEKVPENDLVFVQIPWMVEKNTRNRAYVSVNPQYLVVVDVVINLNEGMRKSQVICRRKEQALPPAFLLKTGVKEVQYPSSLNLLSGTLIHSLNLPNGGSAQYPIKSGHTVLPVLKFQLYQTTTCLYILVQIQ